MHPPHCIHCCPRYNQDQTWYQVNPRGSVTNLQTIFWEVSQHPHRVGKNQMQVFCAWRVKQDLSIVDRIRPIHPMGLEGSCAGGPEIHLVYKDSSSQIPLKAAWASCSGQMPRGCHSWTIQGFMPSRGMKLSEHKGGRRLPSQTQKWRETRPM